MKVRYLKKLFGRWYLEKKMFCMCIVFLKVYIMMVLNMKEDVILDDDDDYADFRYKFRNTMIAQFKQDLSNKNFILQY